MSNNSNLQDDDFKKVTYKRKNNKSKGNIVRKINSQISLESLFNKDEAIRLIEEAIKDLLTTEFYESVTASLQEGLKLLENRKVTKIVCLGLGRIGECLISRYQFALLICLKRIHNVETFVYDPIFTDNEHSLLEYFKCTKLNDNIEGKFKIENKETTLFYLPHCPKQLSNNLIFSNWCLDLSYCIIIANSFNKIIESTSKRELEKNALFISNISPYAVELAIINNFKYYEVFNDTAIHVFPWDNLKLISDDLWKYIPEPSYSEDDIEFITKQTETNFSIKES